MKVAPGTRLGPYEIVSRIGAGGMGEVWRARDTRLDRSVAVKVLPAEFAEDPERRLRFQREARIISQLGHPNICTLFDVGEGYLVMELLEGESLAERVQRGPLPLRDVLRLGAQIAEALDRAHRAGVVHRDLKPGNVMLTKSGAKLLDFGLARSVATVAEDDATLSRPLTQTGAILGTVPYMAPEQFEGREANQRTDIFALGAVLYEMVTGERAFPGANRASVITAILTSEPAPLSGRQPLAPAALEHLLARCLAKDPEERWQSALDLASELRWIAEKGPDGPAVAGTRARRAGPWIVATLALGLVAAGATGAAVWRGRSRPGAGRAEAVAVPRLVRLTWNMRSNSPSVAPDGNSFAYESTASEAAGEKSDIFVRRIGGENPVNLTRGSGADNSSPAYSPDGQSLAFRSERDGGGIFLMGATGESVRRLTSFGYSPAWSPDGRSIAFSSLISEGWAWNAVSSLWVVDVATGAPRKVFEGDAVRPFWSPSGTRLAFDGRRHGMAGGRALLTVAATGGVPTEIASTPGIGWMSGVWTAGWIWFTNPEKGPPSIWRVRVDEATGRPVGAPEPVLRSTSEVSHRLSATPGASRLVFSAFEREMNMLRWEVDPASGRVGSEPRTILSGGRPIIVPMPSPRDEWIATKLIDQSDEFREDILLVHGTTGEIRRLTDDRLRESSFGWAPDGSTLYFCVAQEGGSELWRIRPDGSGRERVLGSTPVGEILAVLASPDGRSLYVEAGKGHGPYLVEVGPSAAGRAPTPLPPMPGGRVFSAWDWSPDGRWMSGVSRKPDGAFDEALVLFDVEGRTYRTLADVKVEKGCFWLPDSRRLLLSGASGEVTVFDRESGSVKPAGSIGPGAFNLCLSRDGRGLYANKVRLMIDVWMLDYGSKP